MGGFSTDWGTSRSYDFDSSPKTVRRTAADYAKDDKREYTGSSSGLGAPVGKNIKTDSPLAAVLVVDVTGSMSKWPGLIFQKIPTLYTEANVVLQGIDLKELEKGKKVDDVLEMSVIAIGDAPKGDSAPLQVGDFAKGADLVKIVNNIYPEGGGAGNGQESYDLAAYFLDNHCQTPGVPKNVKPVLIIAGDEGFYEHVESRYVKDLIGDDIKKAKSTETVIKSLAKKFDTYILRPEPGGYSRDCYGNIHKQWEAVLGSQRVLKMEDPARLVDCIIQICAISADNYDIGKKLLERRQKPDQVKSVLRTMHPLLDK